VQTIVALGLPLHQASKLLPRDFPPGCQGTTNALSFRVRRFFPNHVYQQPFVFLCERDAVFFFLLRVPSDPRDLRVASFTFPLVVWLSRTRCLLSGFPPTLFFPLLYLRCPPFSCRAVHLPTQVLTDGPIQNPSEDCLPPPLMPLPTAPGFPPYSNASHVPTTTPTTPPNQCLTASLFKIAPLSSSTGRFPSPCLTDYLRRQPKLIVACR